MIFILSQKAVLFIYLQTFFHRLESRCPISSCSQKRIRCGGWSGLGTVPSPARRGSCARRDSESDSDVDIMILLDVPKEDVPIERQKIRAIISSLDEKYEYALLISPVIRSYDEFNKWEKVVPFYQNVQSEGVRYA